MSMSVCLSVCLFVCLSDRISQKLHCHTSPNFCACCLWPRLDPALTALRYVMYFRFCGWRHVYTQWALDVRSLCIPKRRERSSRNCYSAIKINNHIHRGLHSRGQSLLSMTALCFAVSRLKKSNFGASRSIDWCKAAVSSCYNNSVNLSNVTKSPGVTSHLMLSRPIHTVSNVVFSCPIIPRNTLQWLRAFQHVEKTAITAACCRAGFKGGAQGARAPGLPPTGGFPPNPSLFCYLLVLRF